MRTMLMEWGLPAVLLFATCCRANLISLGYGIFWLCQTYNPTLLRKVSSREDHEGRGRVHIHAIYYWSLLAFSSSAVLGHIIVATLYASLTEEAQAAYDNNLPSIGVSSLENIQDLLAVLPDLTVLVASVAVLRSLHHDRGYTRRRERAATKMYFTRQIYEGLATALMLVAGVCGMSILAIPHMMAFLGTIIALSAGDYYNAKWALDLRRRILNATGLFSVAHLVITYLYNIPFIFAMLSPPPMPDFVGIFFIRPLRPQPRSLSECLLTIAFIAAEVALIPTTAALYRLAAAAAAAAAAGGGEEEGGDMLLPLSSRQDAASGYFSK
eukprot:jgi/Bigna1/78538/fgenesh1_pg.55_\